MRFILAVIMLACAVASPAEAGHRKRPEPSIADAVVGVLKGLASGAARAAASIGAAAEAHSRQPTRRRGAILEASASSAPSPLENAYSEASGRVRVAFATIAGGGGRPREWCGWYMRQRKGVSDPYYNLARRWADWGRSAGGPRVGAVVVWPHHVGQIVGGSCAPGEWLIESGNDDGAVRTRCRPVRGAIAFTE